jgi:hypothetical protein
MKRIEVNDNEITTKKIKIKGYKPKKFFIFKKDFIVKRYFIPSVSFEEEGIGNLIDGFIVVINTPKEEKRFIKNLKKEKIFFHRFDLKLMKELSIDNYEVFNFASKHQKPLKLLIKKTKFISED